MPIDINAVPANEISIKLRHGESNAKLNRTPYNIESAITALVQEVLDLSGEDSMYRIMSNIGEAFAISKGWEQGAHPTRQSQEHLNIAALVEALVNGIALPAREVAQEIVNELHDMELLDEPRTAELIE